jgi:hypothetical protein
LAKIAQRRWSLDWRTAQWAVNPQGDIGVTA